MNHDAEINAEFNATFDAKIIYVNLALGHAYFRGNYLCAYSALPIQSRVSNLKSLAQVVLTGLPWIWISMDKSMDISMDISMCGYQT